MAAFWALTATLNGDGARAHPRRQGADAVRPQLLSEDVVAGSAELRPQQLVVELPVLLEGWGRWIFPALGWDLHLQRSAMAGRGPAQPSLAPMSFPLPLRAPGALDRSPQLTRPDQELPEGRVDPELTLAH